MRTVVKGGEGGTPAAPGASDRPQNGSLLLAAELVPSGP